MFDWLDGKKKNTEDFCFDVDINQIVLMILDFCQKEDISHDNPKFEIWDHVPYLGYRMSMFCRLKDNQVDVFADKFSLVEEYGKMHQIKVSALNAGGLRDSLSDIFISTMFLDKRKKLTPEKVKKVIKC